MATIPELEIETEAGTRTDNNSRLSTDAVELTGATKAGYPMTEELKKTEGTAAETAPIESTVAHAGIELDSMFGKPAEEKSVFADLYENLLDLFFPKKLPPLELTSTPIPVADPMKVKRNPVSFAISTFVNLSLLALVIYLLTIKALSPPPVKLNATIDLSATDDALSSKKLERPSGGGGGGGEHNKVEAIQGKLPKQSLQPLAPVEQPKINPTLAVDPAVAVTPDLKLPDNPNMPNFGVKNSHNLNVVSAGTGGPAGIGNGHGNGLGQGDGSGVGNGTGGGYGNGTYQIGGDVSKPVLIKSVDPEFTDEARRAKYQGIVIVGITVDAQGNPQNLHVVRALGYGLDEKAIEAVKQYKFKPAYKKGVGPVSVTMQVLVNFHIY